MSETLPEGWRVVRLLDVVSMPSGQVDPTRAPFRGQVLLAPDHIESGTGRILKKETAADQSAVSGKYQVEPGDVAYSKIRPGLRKAALVDFDGTCSADMYPLRPSRDIDGNFLLAVILGEEFSAFASSVSGRSGIPKVNRVEMGEYTFALPSLYEQRKVAEVLDAVDASICDNERSAAKISRLRKAVLAEIMGSGLAEVRSDATFESGSASLHGSWGSRPQGRAWKLLRCAEVLKLAGGSPKLIGEDEEGDFPVYGGNGIIGQSQRPLVDGDVIIIGRVGQYSGAVHYSEVPAWVTDNALYSQDVFGDWDRRFLALYLQWFDLRKSQSLNDNPLVTQASISQIPVAQPPFEEQRRIVSIIEAHDERIAAERARLEKLRKLKAGLMDDLLTGRVRVDQLKDLPV